MKAIVLLFVQTLLERGIRLFTTICNRRLPLQLLCTGHFALLFGVFPPFLSSAFFVDLFLCFQAQPDIICSFRFRMAIFFRCGEHLSRCGCIFLLTHNRYFPLGLLSPYLISNKSQAIRQRGYQSQATHIKDTCSLSMGLLGQ